MSVFRIPFCTHKIIISQSYAFGNLNPPSKTGGIAVAIFSKITRKRQTVFLMACRSLVGILIFKKLLLQNISFR